MSCPCGRAKRSGSDRSPVSSEWMQCSGGCVTVNVLGGLCCDCSSRVRKNTCCCWLWDYTTRRKCLLRLRWCTHCTGLFLSPCRLSFSSLGLVWWARPARHCIVDTTKHRFVRQVSHTATVNTTATYTHESSPTFILFFLHWIGYYFLY